MISASSRWANSSPTCVLPAAVGPVRYQQSTAAGAVRGSSGMGCNGINSKPKFLFEEPRRTHSPPQRSSWACPEGSAAGPGPAEPGLPASKGEPTIDSTLDPARSAGQATVDQRTRRVAGQELDGVRAAHTLSRGWITTATRRLPRGTGKRRSGPVLLSRSLFFLRVGPCPAFWPSSWRFWKSAR
jgi:hypothetical protein